MKDRVSGYFEEIDRSRENEGVIILKNAYMFIGEEVYPIKEMVVYLHKEEK